MHPLNLALRFVLELVMLGALGVYGRGLASGLWGWGPAIGLPVVAGVLWGTFAVPGDPSRGKDGLVAVPGAVRLLLELSLFAVAGWALYAAGYALLALAYVLLLALHYAASGARLRWLLRG